MKKLLLYGTDSRCCRARSIIVKSRDGGFVTQNCEECGKPRKVTIRELPHLYCGECNELLSKTVIGKNYHYRCDDCGRIWEVPEIVFDWNDLFDYHGLGLNTDES